MQIMIPRGEIKDAIGGFSKIVNGKCTLPILGCVRFENRKSGVTAQVTDLDQVARFRFTNAQVDGIGAFIAPLASLKEMAKGDDRESIEFETGKNGSVSITNHVGSHAVKHAVN